jgi:beta-galactosidase
MNGLPQSDSLNPSYKQRLFCASLGALICASVLMANNAFAEERLSLNANWKFTHDDPTNAVGDLSYSKIKNWVEAAGMEFLANPAPVAKPEGIPGGEAISYAQSTFDDSQWRSLNLPHDWGIEGPFRQEYPGETGKLPWWGIGWYRKHLSVPTADAGKKIYLDVDGAMSHATVWLNGQFVGGWPYGYASWRVDLTPFLKFGADNVIAIRLDNPANASRWYPGGGIYRNVWLVKTETVHVGHWGTYVTKDNAPMKTDAARMNLQVSVDNDTANDVVVSLRNEIFKLGTDNKAGKAVSRQVTPDVKVAAHSTQTNKTWAVINKPELWSLEKPQRYLLVTTVERDGKAVDRYETPFGVRTIEFTATNGFLLNGKRVPLNGVCDHADLGALGTVVNTRGIERQIEILKEMGCNAIRTSHNPPAPELLDLCDRMGMLVMDESFDCWKRAKKPNDYHLLYDAWHEKDWRAELRRDRNHPSIILWSIGNEIPEQGRPEGPAMAAELSRIAHEEDPTRPTTAACNDTRSAYNGYGTNLDVFGYNYKPGEFGKFRKANPNQPVYGSETSSCISSRGEYFFPFTPNKNGGQADFQMSSYDIYSPGWATLPDWEFKGQDQFPFSAGEFVWTGFDYLGEPTPYKELEDRGNKGVPSRSSYFGIIDLAGFKKDRFYLYQARWRQELPMAHILPHWNWPNRIGEVTPVHVYTSGDEAELFLNGKSLGRKKKEQYQYRIIWNDVTYQPGELKVVTYKNGKKWATEVMKTTGPARKLTMQPDRAKIRADGKDLSYVTVTVADKSGLMVPRSKNHIQFSVEGPGEIVATDNGDATSLVSFQSPERDAYNGLALVIVRAKPGQAGNIILKAKADGLESCETKIAARK